MLTQNIINLCFAIILILSELFSGINCGILNAIKGKKKAKNADAKKENRFVTYNDVCISPKSSENGGAGVDQQWPTNADNDADIQQWVNDNVEYEENQQWETPVDEFDVAEQPSTHYGEAGGVDQQWPPNANDDYARQQSIQWAEAFAVQNSFDYPDVSGNQRYRTNYGEAGVDQRWPTNANEADVDEQSSTHSVIYPPQWQTDNVEADVDEQSSTHSVEADVDEQSSTHSVEADVGEKSSAHSDEDVDSGKWEKTSYAYINEVERAGKFGTPGYYAYRGCRFGPP